MSSPAEDSTTDRSIGTATSAGAVALATPTHPAAANAQRLQLLTREQRQFSDVEAGLPSRNSALAASGPGRVFKAVSQASAKSSRLTDFLSILGPKNPLPQPVTDKDSVWILDNVAYKDAQSGRWQAEYVVAVMAQHPTSKVVDAVKAVADKLGKGPEDDADLQTIEKRITPFLQDILPGRQVAALHGEDWRLVFSPGGRNGLSSDVRRLPGADPGALVPTRAEVPAGATGVLHAQTFFPDADAGSWGVISDIDDTIKLTQTSDPIGILQKTFVDPPTPIPDMPEFYKYMQAQLGSAAPFFYLSASPYNLYPFLHEFRRDFYPHGALILRDASVMSVAGLLSTLTLGTQAYKVDRMHKIHRWLPRNKFVCLGDSTQSDPEAYGEIYRTYPGWVKQIFIRKVTDIAELGIAEKNEPDRFEKAFDGVPKDVWHVFEDPSELYPLLDAVLAREGGADAPATTAAATTTTAEDADIAA